MIAHPWIPLLLAIGCACGADREQFTLKDGRVLVGSYDEATQTLAIESPKASMHVDARDIAKREEAPPAVAAELKRAPVDTAPRVPAGVSELRAKRKAMNEAEAVARAAEKDYQTARSAFLEHYLRNDADLTPLLVHVPDNPTAAQLAEAKRVTDFNKFLKSIQRWRDENDTTPGASDPILGPGTIMQYAKGKGVAWLLDL